MEFLKEYNKPWERDEFAPLNFWAWNENMDDDSIKQRIKEFHDQGFKGFFMHSRGGLLTPYLKEEWFHACRVAADTADEYGMKAWIYDEDGWPSGFAGGLVTGLGVLYQSKYMEFTREKEPQNLIAAFLEEDGNYKVCRSEDANLWAYYCIEPNYVDLLSHKVTEAFIESTYERYKTELGERLGESVPGFFTDEPQYNGKGFPYSLELETYFEKRNGYPLSEKLYYLVVESEGEESRSFRKDYWNTIQDMMKENYFKQIYDWCEKNHVIFTGHCPGEDSLIYQIGSTGGVMPKYKYMQMPGIDHLGRRITSVLLTKQVTSAAKQTGRKKIISETFGCAGWNISFEQQCYIWGWQAAAGINVPCLHIGTHSIRGIRKRDYPAFYAYQEPWWENYHHMSSWMSGLNYKMALGDWMEEVLVISPMQSIYCCHTKNLSAQEKELAASYRNLCENLMDVQIGFDIGDEDILKEDGLVNGNVLEVGKCCYRFVIVSKGICLLDTTWKLLKEFKENGGTVIFSDGKPEEIKNQDAPWVKECVVIQNARRFWYKYFLFLHYNRLVAVYDKSGFEIAKGLNVSVKKDQDIIRAYIWSFLTDSNRELKVSIPGNKSVYSVDPETLERKRLYAYFGEQETIVPVKLSGYQTVLLEAEDSLNEAVPDIEYKKVEVPGLEVSCCNDNVLSIDYASYSLDGENYSGALPIVKLHPRLYKDLAGTDKNLIYTKYEFTSELENTQELYAAVEDKDCIDILCNGSSVFAKAGDWYIDRGIHKYSLKGNLQKGSNTVIVIYQLQEHKLQDVEGLYETEVNRFYYPVEPEAIYILGNFEVGLKGEVYNNRTHIRAKNPGFFLKKQEEVLNIQDVTTQGYWFYRGNIKIDFTVNWDGVEEKYIHIKNPNAACVEIRCKDNSDLLYLSPYEKQIDGFLQKGDNTISVILHGTNRNIFGPHHHIKGENNYVGCNTFKGIRSYEDYIVNYDIVTDNTWTDDYSFVPFGCEGIEIITK